VSSSTRRIPAEGRPGPESLSQANDTQSLPAASDGNEHPEQAPLFPVARARNRIDAEGRLHRDPEPSFQAARSQSPERITALQRAIVNTLQLARQPLTDEQIVERVKRMSWAAESGVRSRRAELVRQGVLEVVDSKGLTQHGRPCRRYQVRAD
jgi:hypothetical protein